VLSGCPLFVTRRRISPNLSNVTERRNGKTNDEKGAGRIHGRIRFFPYALSLGCLPFLPRTTVCLATHVYVCKVNEARRFVATSVHAGEKRDSLAKFLG
jgi:hypothetical protein